MDLKDIILTPRIIIHIDSYDQYLELCDIVMHEVKLYKSYFRSFDEGTQGVNITRHYGHSHDRVTWYEKNNCKIITFKELMFMNNNYELWT